MKKRIGAILIFIGLCVVLATVISPNRKLIINEILAMFKKTEYLNYGLTVDNLGEIDIGGPVELNNTDERGCAYTNKVKMQKVLDYLNNMPLVKADEDELANQSADVLIRFYDTNDNIVGCIYVYGQVFIKDTDTGQIYRSKDENIIEGLEKIQF